MNHASSKRVVKKVSVVVPCHNEKNNVNRFYSALCLELDGRGLPFELIYVDDSTDGQTHLLIEKLHESDGRVSLVRLTRSYGQSVAIFAGLERITGDVAVVMDCDLEDPPSAIPIMIEKWSEGYDVVLARRKRVGLKLSYRLFQTIYYRTSKLISQIDIPESVGEFRLLDAKVVRVISAFDEKIKFFRGLSLWPGFRTTIIDIHRNERTEGVSQYNFYRASSVAIDGLVSFSSFPLRVIALTGIAMSTFSAALAVAYFVWRLLDPGAFGIGWTSLFLAIVFATGINLLFLGVVAEYVGRIFQQVQNRPAYVVDYTLQTKENTNG